MRSRKKEGERQIKTGKYRKRLERRPSIIEIEEEGATSTYQKIQLLGKGIEGEAYLFEKEGKGGEKEQVVVKKLKAKQPSRFSVNEARMNLVYGDNAGTLITEDDESSYLFLPFFDGVELSSFIYESEQALKEDIQNPLTLIRGILAAYADLHSKNIVHGDPGGWNILIDRQGEVRVCDFGKSFKAIDPHDSSIITDLLDREKKMVLGMLIESGLKAIFEENKKLRSLYNKIKRAGFKKGENTSFDAMIKEIDAILKEQYQSDISQGKGRFVKVASDGYAKVKEAIKMSEQKKEVEEKRKEFLRINQEERAYQALIADPVVRNYMKFGARSLASVQPEHKKSDFIDAVLSIRDEKQEDANKRLSNLFKILTDKTGQIKLIDPKNFKRELNLLEDVSQRAVFSRGRVSHCDSFKLCARYNAVKPEISKIFGFAQMVQQKEALLKTCTEYEGHLKKELDNLNKKPAQYQDAIAVVIRKLSSIDSLKKTIIRESKFEEGPDVIRKELDHFKAILAANKDTLSVRRGNSSDAALWGNFKKYLSETGLGKALLRYGVWKTAGSSAVSNLEDNLPNADKNSSRSNKSS